MTRIILWRHGNTDFNASGTIQGQTDVPLNERGLAQASAAAVALAELKPQRLISSDLSRAMQTASALAALTGLEIEPDARLRERSFGQFETMTMDQVKEKYPDGHALWQAGKPPGYGVELVSEVGKRAAEVIREASAGAGDGLVVLATHGAAAKYAMCEVMGWPEETHRAFGFLENCHWVELLRHQDRWVEVARHSARWQVAGYNLGV